MNNNSNDIVITGLAAISAAGVGLAPLEETLRTGVSRLQQVPEEILGETGHLWGRADSFKVTDFMPPLKARKFDRCSQFAVVAAGMAIKDARLDLKDLDLRRVGILLGCGFGGIANSEEFLRGYFTNGMEGLAPVLFPNTVANASASNASIELGLRGPNVTVVQRFCSAESTLLMAQRFLEEDRADVILVGGVDELTPMVMKGFQALGQLRRHAAGFGEGAGMLVLEKRGHARVRGAAVRATLGEIRTIGLILPGHEREGADRLLGGKAPAALVSLSGSAAAEPLLLERLPAGKRLEIAPLVGRSLAMGGVALVALVLSLAPGQIALHLAASPEGPYYAVDLQGGDPV